MESFSLKSEYLKSEGVKYENSLIYNDNYF
jgi:hypothetical protein